MKHKRGDIREDGKVFSKYDSKGYEYWVTPEQMNRQKQLWKKSRDKARSTKLGHAKHIIGNRKNSAKNKNVEFSISEDVLLQNIPDVCPILGIKLSWGLRKGLTGNKDSSPSIDKVIPELGYVEGNVMWMSHKANVMKYNATPEELKTFANWILTNA